MDGGGFSGFVVVLLLAALALFFVMATLHLIVLAVLVVAIILLPGFVAGAWEEWRSQKRKAENSNPSDESRPSG